MVEDAPRLQSFLSLRPRLAIRRLKRSKSLEQKQAVGINHDILVKMIAAQPDTLAGTRNRALLSLGYDFLARRSELVAIRNRDLKFTPDGALKGMIRKSKTDQYGRGRFVFGSERSAKLVRTWLRLKPQEIQPVFCAINHGKCKDRAICDRNVNDIINRDVDNFHSAVHVCFNAFKWIIFGCCKNFCFRRVHCIVNTI